MQPVGIARTEIEIVDLSVLVATGLKGIHAVAGVTKWGKIGKPTLVGSWPEFVKYFGGLSPDSLFPLICRRALESGAKLLVSSVGHYTDITDNTTLDGTPATGDITILATPETLASGDITITAAGTNGDVITLKVGALTIATYTKVAGDTPSDIATGLRASCNSLGATTNYSATSVGATLTTKAPAGTGATANGTTVTRTFSGGATMTTSVASYNLAGGVTAVVNEQSVWEADSIGEWGNDVTVTTVAAQSGNPAQVDITIAIAGYPDYTQSIKNFPKVPTAQDIDNLKQVYKYAYITAFTTSMPIGTVTLSGGAKSLAITTTDYVGDQIAETGIHAFDTSSLPTKISCPEIADPILDMALANYADARKDLIAVVRTPVGVDGATAVDYREGTGIYSHQPIDTWRAFMFTGGLYVIDPLDGQKKYIPELGDVLGCMSNRDNKQKEWFTFAGSKRGRIKNCLGVAYNLGSAARQASADLVDVRGINMVIEHPDFGVVAWGNSTLQKADTLLKHANVAELMIFLTRALKPLIQSELFDPNDIQTWKAIHRRVIPLMELVKNGRGIWKYLYQGDQDVDDVSQCTVNQPSNIDAGMYEFRIFVAPKVGMKYVGLKVAVTNSNVDFEIFEAEAI